MLIYISDYVPSVNYQLQRKIVGGGFLGTVYIVPLDP